MNKIRLHPSLSVFWGIFFGLSLLLNGCTGRKKLSRSVENSTMQRVETTGRQAERWQADLSETVDQVAQTDFSEAFDWEATIYDTSKPPDSTTGLPPVLAEVSARKKNVLQIREATETLRTDRSVSTSDTRTQTVATAESDLKVVENSKTVRRWPWWGSLPFIILVLWGALMIYRKRRGQE